MALADELRAGAHIHSMPARNKLHAPNLAAARDVVDRIDLLAGVGIHKGGSFRTHAQDAVKDRPEAVGRFQLPALNVLDGRLNALFERRRNFNETFGRLSVPWSWDCKKLP